MLPFLSFLVFTLTLSLAPLSLSLSLPNSIQRLHGDALSDEHALMAFKNSLPLQSLQDWIPNNQTMCNWTGVTCSSRQRVISLNLEGMALHGPISPFIGNLSSLRVLFLWNNTFHGHIPYELGRLSHLRILRLSINELQGSIPASLGRCRNLRRLYLSYNNLSGSIPAQLGLLSNLQTMALGGNQLTGEIPSFIGNMSTTMTVLTLEQNRLHGPIPTALSNLTQLQYFMLYDNHLSGHIPWELGKLSYLQYFYLWGNSLTGEIPGSLSNCTQLLDLELARNRLSGTVPIEFGDLLHLQILRLQDNQLVSVGRSLSILTALTNCSQLKEIDLSYNYFSGFLPSSVGQLSSLVDLNLGPNQLEGNIPGEIGNLKNLTLLGLNNNHFTGTIPPTFGRLQNLESLYLEGNYVHGKIPKNLDQLKRLGLLSLRDNMLSGQIPDTLGNLPQLRRLFLDHNQLSGQIPAELGRCLTLELVDLAYNKLSGYMPREVAGLPNLQFYFNASNNLLEGFLPVEIGKMVMVQAIDVSVNQLSGGIPRALASCTNLGYLNLSRNAFQGPIPNSVADLKNLEDMDLSCNNLSGTIPVALKNMKALKQLNLSSNKLIGEVPKSGIFTRIDASAFAGNLGLCGSWIHLPACAGFKHQRSLILKRVIIIVVIAGAVFLVCLLFFVSYLRRKSKGRTGFTLKFGPPIISYEEIVDATQGFNENNIIGTGSFGSVYKGTLNNGTDVAIKVLNLQDEVHQSFHRECNALRRARHRNVIKIITSCTNLDFRALVLPFMSNGNLQRWIHPPRGDAFKLNLSERLRIAMEIAEGMAYLHHHSFVQIVHCDLKPSNVLLGDDMTAYIADFGIAKLIFGDSVELTSTNAFQGSIGYVAPEYGIGGIVSTKGDVYSYGIVLLELLTRKKPTDYMFEGGMSLRKWAGMDFPNRVREVVDNFLLEDVNESEMTTVLTCIRQLMQVGLDCANDQPQQRPDMMAVVNRLDKIKVFFLGIERTFELPIDISSLINTSSSGNGGSNESWSTGTF